MTAFTPLSEDEGRVLVARARAAAERGLRGTGRDAREPPAVRDIPEALAAPGASIATWLRDARPRGSSGSFEAGRSLIEDAERNAASALLEAPRVPRPSARELGSWVLEIDVVRSPTVIVSLSEIEIGVHGVHIALGKRRASLLPRAGPEFGWGPERLLEQLCVSAGLRPEAWRGRIRSSAAAVTKPVTPEETYPAPAGSPSDAQGLPGELRIYRFLIESFRG